MTTILTATKIDAQILSALGEQTFLESHGHSASKADIDKYIASKFSLEALEKELKKSENIYHILYHNEIPIGYSKILLNVPHENISLKNISKLERLYVLKAYHSLKLGAELFNYTVSLSKSRMQSGIWLYTWVENHRAINFYNKIGFKIVGSFDFKISDTHYNPNHQMFLKY